MRGYTHVAFAVCTVPVLPNTHPVTLLGLLSGSLFPDVDVKGSPASKIIYIPVKHRTFFHSFAACATFTLLLYFISKDFAIGFCVGYISHIFLDTLNVAGVQLLWPLKKQFHIMRIRVGSIKEYVALLIFSIIDFFIIVSTL